MPAERHPSTASRARANSSAEPMGGSQIDRPMSQTCCPCRSKKIKCDSRSPPCANCVKSGTAAECSYRTKLKPGLRAGGQQETSKRLEVLENIVAAHSQKFEYFERNSYLANGASQTPGLYPPSFPPPAMSHSHSHVASLHAAPPSEAYSPISTSAASHRPSDIKVDLSLDTNVFASPPSASSAGVGSAFGAHLHGFPQGPMSAPPTQSYFSTGPMMSETPQHQPVSIAAAGGFPAHLPPAAPSPIFSIASGPFAGESQDLPPEDIINNLIDLYYSRIHPTLPIIPRTSLSMASPDGRPSILVYAVVIATLRFSLDPRWGASGSGLASKKWYHDAARQRIIMHAIESSSVASLQALTLVCLDTIGSGKGPQAWGILALVTKSVVHLGLQHEEDEVQHAPGSSKLGGGASGASDLFRLHAVSILPPAETWEDEETRRKLYWVIQMIDGFASAASGLAGLPSEPDGHRRLPVREELWRGGSPVEAPRFRSAVWDDDPPGDRGVLGPGALMVEVVDLLSKVHTFQRESVQISNVEEVKRWSRATQELDGKLKRWFERRALENVDPVAERGVADPMLVLVLATYHATRVKLNSHIAYPPLTSPHLTANASAQDKCVSSARAIASLAAGVSAVSELGRMSLYVAWAMWVAARVLFIESYLKKRDLDPHFQTLTMALLDMGAYWELAQRYATTLRRAIKKLAAHVVSRAQASAPSTGTGVSDASSGRCSSASHGAADLLPAEPSTPLAISVLLDMRKTAYGAEAEIPPSRDERADGHALPQASAAFGGGVGAADAAMDPFGGPRPNSGMELGDLGGGWAGEGLLRDLHGWFEEPPIFF